MNARNTNVYSLGADKDRFASNWFYPFNLTVCDDSLNLKEDKENITENPIDLTLDSIPIYDDDYWEMKRTSCSFCRMFLESPCAEEFKQWHKCIDLAKVNKEDYVECCRNISSSLFGCVNENPDTFSSFSENTSNDDK